MPSRVLFGFAVLVVLSEMPLFAEEKSGEQQVTDGQSSEKPPVPATKPPRPPNEEPAAEDAAESDLDEAIDLLRQLLDRLQQVRRTQQGDTTTTGRDPFSTTKTMRQRAGGGQSGSAAPRSVNVPSMRITGIAAGEEGSFVALLEVEGNETYFIRKGQTLNLGPEGGQFLVKEITGEAVQMEIEALGKVITVR